VVVNPAAGGSPLTLAGNVAEQLACEGFGPRILITAHRGEAVEAVAEAVANDQRGGRDLALVLAVGGDGTAREVAEGMARGTGSWPGGGDAVQRHGRETPALFVVPGGTGNSLYRALFADVPVQEALRMVLGSEHSGARLRQLDLGRLVELDQAVVLGASAGLLASVLDTAHSTPEVSGRRRYEQAALELIGHPDELGTDVRVLVDGAVLVAGRLLLVALGGARHRGGSFELLPGSVLDDGLFDVCAIEMPAPERFGELFVAVAGGCHLGEPEVTYARGHNVVIEAAGDEAVPVEYDGDLMAGALPAGQSVTFEVVGGVLAAWAADPPPAG
jgi:diacylglycerol kinase (ATP)